MYENAMGVPQDRAQALGWYMLGAAGDDDDSKKAVDRLKKTLGFGDMSKAQAFAKNYTTTKGDQ